MNKNKKTLMLSILGIIILVLITIGVTYAFFNYAKEGTTDNVITTGSITFLYTEVSGVENGISIENAFPMSDEKGKVLTGKGEYFDFKITSNTMTDTSIPYEVTARKKANSTLSEEAVKLYLTKGQAEEEVLLAKYSDLNQTDKVDSSKYTEKTIYTGKVPANTEDYEENFRLRMWISEDTDFSQNEDGTYPYNDKEFTVTVNVYANAKVVTEEEITLESNTTISSLSIDNTELTAAEGQDYDYTIRLDEGTTSAKIEIETENEHATVNVEKIDSVAETTNVKRLSTVKTLMLEDGDNNFKITVTSEDKEIIQEYLLKIKVSDKLTLSEAIFEKYPVIDATPNLKNSSNNTTEESGLYKWTDPDDETIQTYYFRGNVDNNYVKFADQIWRVVRINEDGTVRLILQDGINNNAGYKALTGCSNYYTQSSENYINPWYITNIEEPGYSNFVSTGDYFCEQAKVKHSNSNYITGVTMTLYSGYSPTFKCEPDGLGYGLVNSSIGLITYDEAVYAGGYYGKNNTNYYLNNGKNYWMLNTAGNYKYNSYTTYCSHWLINSNGSITADNPWNGKTLRPVINLNANVTASGSGISGDEWVVE